MNIKAVLFDFDGTLMYTNELVFGAYSHAFKRVFNRDITDEEIHSLFGRPLYDSLADFGAENQDALFSAYKEFSDDPNNVDEMVHPFENADEGVRILHDAGFKTGIVTSKRRDSLMRGIVLLNSAELFDVLITPEDTVKHKPEPDPILAACEKLGVKPEETVYVGDSVFDFRCAVAAGTLTAGVNYSTTLDAIMKYDPDFMADDIADLARQLIVRRG